MTLKPRFRSLLIAGCLSGMVALAVFAAPAAANTCTGSENPAIVWTTPLDRFVDNGDGTVSDTITSLMWLRCPLGQAWNDGVCDGDADLHDWQTALQAADGFTFAGFADWRVPNLKEFNATVEQRCRNPAANDALFPGVAGDAFWSSSPYAGDIGNASYAWTVDFRNGIDTIRTKTTPLRVRLVRDVP